tara:strand:- start:3526 stop:3951 length:426 start_codon:yes stop_codon:yes gene_type:complete
MKKKKKIGWQKYEDVLENQLSSPIFRQMLTQLLTGAGEGKQEEESFETEDTPLSEGEEQMEGMPIFGMSNEMVGDLAMATMFDCWVGHTNFDITPSMATTIDSVEGVELLKVCSRYRFFIGVGKMFNFKNVRKTLEGKILN